MAWRAEITIDGKPCGYIICGLGDDVPSEIGGSLAGSDYGNGVGRLPYSPRASREFGGTAPRGRGRTGTPHDEHRRTLGGPHEHHERHLDPHNPRAHCGVE